MAETTGMLAEVEVRDRNNVGLDKIEQQVQDIIKGAAQRCSVEKCPLRAECDFRYIVDDSSGSEKVSEAHYDVECYNGPDPCGMEIESALSAIREI